MTVVLPAEILTARNAGIVLRCSMRSAQPAELGWRQQHNDNTMTTELQALEVVCAGCDGDCEGLL